MRLENVLGKAFLVGLVAAAAFSCSSGDDSSSGGAGTSGKGGAGGTNNAGAGGNGGAAGASTSGTGGGKPSGGSGGMQNSAAGEAGAAASGGEPTGNSGVCGDGHLDSGEQCDDGNTTSNDGCSATCTIEACDLCMATGMHNADFQGCVLNSTVPDGGTPALADEAAVALCQQILECTRTSRCVAAPTGAEGMFSDPAEDCYCGTLADSDCFALTPDPNHLANGPCHAVIEQAVPVGGPLAIGAVYFDTTSPVGAAIQRAEGESQFCAAECAPLGAAGASGQ
jgi:cysteine-rich repeat protein